MPKKTKVIKVTDIKGDKPWLKKTGIFKYAIESIEKKKRFLIVCEGQTESLYFKSFPVLTADIKSVHQGCSRSALVACTHAYTEQEDYDEIWCVFDMDFTPDNELLSVDFNNAIKAAYDAGYNCAYSNDAFELWFVLHYQFIDQKKLRDFYFDVLSKYWQVNYQKEGKTRAYAQSVYERLLNDERASQAQAIKSADKLFELQKDKAYHIQNPVTTVYQLVQELNLHLR